MKIIGLLAAAAVLAPAAYSPALAAPKDVQLTKCAQPYGSVALVDGDTQGWTEFGLGSPRELLGVLVAESNCFTLHDPSSGKPADFLMSAIAGSKEEVSQGVSLAKTALTEGALRTGALGAMSSVPMAGAALRLFSGFGGKKKSVSAGLKLINPATGQALIAGTGQSAKTKISWGGIGEYGTSKDGKLLTSAFASAYNAMVAQAGALPPRTTAAAATAQ